MPLPDAPPPKTSRVYQQLTGKLLSTLTSDQYNTIKDPVYIDRNAEDEIRRLLLVGNLTGHISSSGTIADSGGDSVSEVAFDAATGATIFPPIGEVWRIQLLILTNNTDVTIGSIPQMVTLGTAGDTSTQTNAQFLLDSATNINAGNSLRLTDNLLGLSQDLTLTSKVGLRYSRVAGSPTSGTLKLTVMYVNER